MGGLALRNTLKPQMHFISGRRDSSSTVTGVPQRMHSYVTFAPVASEEEEGDDDAIYTEKSRPNPQF
jgi:myo-inositol-hexaphosphate 3-phosphohydrolase